MFIGNKYTHLDFRKFGQRLGKNIHIWSDGEFQVGEYYKNANGLIKDRWISYYIDGTTADNYCDNPKKKAAVAARYSTDVLGFGQLPQHEGTLVR